MIDTADRGLRVGEVSARLAQVRSVLDHRNQLATLLQTRPNFAWLTAGGSGHVLQSSETSIAAILVTGNDVVAITQNIEAARLAEEELGQTGIEVVAVPWWEPRAIEAEASRRLPTGQRPASDDEIEVDLGSIRSVLSKFDQIRLAALAGTTRDAADGALATVAVGMTEDQLAAEVLSRLPGVRVPVLLVAADERIIRYRHPLPSHNVIRSRVMLVIVAEQYGLHVAVTRMCELEAPTADIARRIEAVAHVQAAMHDATRAGNSLGSVVDAARRAYAAAGFPDEWRSHHQGGSIGYRARERVAIPGDPTAMEAGMAFAWNPSIAGAKAEATVILEGDRRVRTITG